MKTFLILSLAFTFFNVGAQTLKVGECLPIDSIGTTFSGGEMPDEAKGYFLKINGKETSLPLNTEKSWFIMTNEAWRNSEKNCWLLTLNREKNCLQVSMTTTPSNSGGSWNGSPQGLMFLH